MTGPQNYHHPKLLQLVSSFVSYLVFTHGVWLPVRQCDIHRIPILMILASLLPAALPELVCECVCARQWWSGGESMHTRSCQRTSRPRPDSTRSSLHRINLIYTQRGNLPIKHTHLQSLSPPFTVCPTVSLSYKTCCVLDQRRRDDTNPVAVPWSAEFMLLVMFALKGSSIYWCSHFHFLSGFIF